MSSLLRPALQSFEFTPDLDGWLAAHTPADANAHSRERVIDMFRTIIARNKVEPAHALSRFYAGLRTVCLLSPLTARTYLNYVIGGMRLSPALREVRDVRKLANRLAAIEAPVRPVRVVASDDLVLAIAGMPSGPEKRAAVLMLSTGARCADVAKLQADEIVVEDSTHARTRLQIAWSETKARKDYGARITISYPSAVVGTILSGMLLEVAAVRGAPCAGVTAQGVNRALRVVGSKASTRSFRVAFVSRAREHLDATESARPLSTLTGHYSDAIPAGVYERHAVQARSRQDRQKRERAVSFLGEEHEQRPAQPSAEPTSPERTPRPTPSSRAVSRVLRNLGRASRRAPPAQPTPFG